MSETRNQFDQQVEKIRQIATEDNRNRDRRISALEEKYESMQKDMATLRIENQKILSLSEQTHSLMVGFIRDYKEEQKRHYSVHERLDGRIDKNDTRITWAYAWATGVAAAVGFGINWIKNRL
jgi:hypothetical protein